MTRNENYWKDAYKDTWGASSKRENELMAYLETRTQMKMESNGLGAGTTDYISGSASCNGYQKGDADFVVVGTNIYVEVTGPLVKNVTPEKPLWFRPDKVNNAVKNCTHDVFFAHHCMSADLWRVIHVDDEFKRRFRRYEFPVVTPYIRERRERFIEIDANDRCIHDLQYLVDYIKSYGQRG